MLKHLKALLILFLISGAFSQETSSGECACEEIPSSKKALKMELGSLEQKYFVASDRGPLKSSSPGYKSDRELEKNAIISLGGQLGTHFKNEMYESVSDSIQIKQNTEYRTLDRTLSNTFTSKSNHYIKNHIPRLFQDEKENIKELYIFLCKEKYECERRELNEKLREAGKEHYDYYKRNQDDILIQFKSVIKAHFYYKSMSKYTRDDMATLIEIEQKKEELYLAIKDGFPKNPMTVYQARDVIGEPIRIKANLPDNFPLKLISNGYINPDWGEMQTYQGQSYPSGGEIILDGFAVQSDIEQTLNFFPDIGSYYDGLKYKEKLSKDTFESLQNEILDKTFYSFKIEIAKPKLGFDKISIDDPPYNSVDQILGKNTIKELESVIKNTIIDNEYFDFFDLKKSSDKKNTKILDVRYNESDNFLSFAINDNDYKKNPPFFNEKYLRFASNDIRKMKAKISQGLNDIAETGSTGKLQYSVCPDNSLKINGVRKPGSLNPQTILDLPAGLMKVQLFSKRLKKPYVDTQIYITAGEQGTDLASSIKDLDNRYLEDSQLCFSDENETIYQLIIKGKPSNLKEPTLKWDNEDKSSLLKSGENVIQIPDKSLSSHSIYVGYRGYQAHIEVNYDGKEKINKKVRINKTISEIVPISVDLKKVEFKIQDILVPGTTQIRYYADKPKNKIIGNIWRLLSGAALLYTISEADNYFIHKEKYKDAIEAYEDAIMGDVSNEDWGNLSNEILLQKDLANTHQSNLVKGGSFLGLGISINIGKLIFKYK